MLTLQAADVLMNKATIPPPHCRSHIPISITIHNEDVMNIILATLIGYGGAASITVNGYTDANFATMNWQPRGIYWRRD
jgi:hypothetical protein